MSTTTRPSSQPKPRANPPGGSAGELIIRHAGSAAVRAGGLWPFAWKLTGIAGVLALAAWGIGPWLVRDNPALVEVTGTVTRADLPVTVTERGDLSSSKTVNVLCEVEGEQTKIAEIVPEGTRVTEGQVVIRFDTEKLGRAYAEQEVKARTAESKAKSTEEDLEVQKNKAESEIAKSRLSLKLAKIDLRKYLEGELIQERRNIEGEILVATKELKGAEERLAFSEKLNKKGYVSNSEMEADRLAVAKARNTFSIAKEKMRVLEEFSVERQTAELTANAEETERELDRTIRSQNSTTAKLQSEYLGAKDTAAIEKAQLERLKAQLEHCVVKAPQEGILVYDNSRWWDPTSRIRAGAIVYFQQPLYSLPDLTQMQAKVKIHESAVKKVKPGQDAELRAEAVPGVVMHGKVDKVATLAENRGYRDQGGVKEYETIVKIDDLPMDAGLKPGMTVEIKILVNRVSDVLIVPVQSVAEKDGEYFSYVVNGKAIERRRVTVGENNETFVEIKLGLTGGEQVALDARARLAAETNGGKENGKALPKAPAFQPKEKESVTVSEVTR